MIQRKLKEIQQMETGISIETKEDLFFLYADKGRFNKTNLKKLLVGRTIFIEGVDLESEDYITGPGIITKVYNENHKLLYTAKKPRSSLKNYL